MAHITIEEVEKVASLARLEFTGEEKKKFAEQFSKIVGFVEKISELDTENVLPTTHAVEKRNVVREDEVKPSMTIEEIENIVPKSIDGNIVVTKVVEF